jgi:DNA-binding NarL/FixJ family response regulator
MTEIKPSIRVLVVDDQRLMRDGIASLLGIQEGIAVVGDAANGEEAVAQALALTPDVILMDVRMPVMDGVTATAQVRQKVPTCQVIMLTTFDDEESIVKALVAGASGYLLKNIPVEDLAQAIRLVERGIYQLEPSIVNKLMGALVAPNRLATPAAKPEGKADLTMTDLSEREREVLRLIARGATNREIANHLIISEGTVKNHVSNILSRLNLRDRTQAALYARDVGLL